MVIVERTLSAHRSPVETAAAALRGGATAIQLRNKDDSARELLLAAKELLPLREATGALLIVNDRLDVALASGADGVHLGQFDLPVAAARRVAPPGFAIGYSTDDPAAARRSVADGASYIGCGTVFPTSTKPDAGRAIGPEGVLTVSAGCDAPVVAIGGITPANVAKLAGTCTGVAAVGALMAAEDPEAVAVSLRTGFDGGVR